MAPANEMLDPHSGARPEGFKLAIMLDSQTWAYQLDPDKFGTGVAFAQDLTCSLRPIAPPAS